MRVRVDPWDPGYGSAAVGEADESSAPVDLDVELPAAAWTPVPAPLPGDLPVPACIVFVDGVRRVDARVWLDDEPGLCASWAAGAIVCDGTAEVAAVETGHGLFTAEPSALDLVTVHGTYVRRAAAGPAPEQLSLALQQAMTASEVAVAEQARGTSNGLLVVDGPLRGRQHLTDAVGLVKSHHLHYLPQPQRGVLAALAPGERTPVFTIGGGYVRHSWYVRLPRGGDGPMGGVVRCECSADRPAPEAVRLASSTATVLPRFASDPHKDTRAPQNLYPIGGLERVLRRRLGDAALLYRALRAAAA
jgi:hypothetical protein